MPEEPKPPTVPSTVPPTFEAQRNRPLLDLFENLGDTSDEVELAAKKIVILADHVAGILDDLKSGGLEFGLKVGDDYIPLSLILKLGAKGRLTQQEVQQHIRTFHPGP